MKLAAESLTGAWRLLSWEAVDAKGGQSVPFGENPIGRIQYDPDGRVFALLIRADRPPAGWFLFGEATAEEKARAFDSGVGYYGTYEVDGDRVVHHIEAATMPTFTGTDIERRFRIDGNRLQLSFMLAADGKPSGHTLTWERV